MEKIDIKKFTSIEAGRVSIIMALYNMESLVYRAVSSVINQTYQNIEVIIIDDGSRDKGGAICDEIALEDNRVKVFHQENTGIAGAYLNAFKYVTGEYVLFVDSDDFIDPRMVEFLIETISKTDADIAQCRRKYFFDSKNNPEVEKYSDDLKIKVLGSTEEILDDYFFERNILRNECDKLFRTNLFEGVECQKGMQHIDVIILMQVIVKCQKYAYIENVLYYVYKKPDSISRGEYNEMHWNDYMYINNFYQDYISKFCPQYLDFMHYRWVKSSMIACERMSTSKIITDKKLKIGKCREICRKNYRAAKVSKYYKDDKLMTHLKCFIFYMSPTIFMLINKVCHEFINLFVVKTVSMKNKINIVNKNE